MKFKVFFNCFSVELNFSYFQHMSIINPSVDDINNKYEIFMGVCHNIECIITKQDKLANTVYYRQRSFWTGIDWNNICRNIDIDIYAISHTPDYDVSLLLSSISHTWSQLGIDSV